MSQKGDIVVLVPGPGGWEVWEGPPAGELQLVEAGEANRAGELGKLPHGDVVMLFPVRAVTSIPFRGATDDDDLFSDLAAMHIERLGLRPDENAGQLIDSFVVTREDEATQLLTVVLRAPEEGDLPPRSPKEFDLSARTLPLPEHGVALWREFGRWVFAIGGPGGQLAYAQATACEEEDPDDSVTEDLGLALTQLALQGIVIDPRQVVVWTDVELAGQGKVLDQVFPGRVRVEARPSLRLPEKRSKLLPEDVRAARRERSQRHRQIALAAIVGLAYFGLVGWLGFSLWQDLRQAKKLGAKAESMRPVAEAFETHSRKWDEMAPVVDSDEFPVQLLYRCVRQIPPNSKLRISTAELTGDERGLVKQIRLVGEAAEPGPIQKFSLALRRSDLLSDFQWELPPPQQSKKGNWSFTFTGARQDI